MTRQKYASRLACCQYTQCIASLQQPLYALQGTSHVALIKQAEQMSDHFRIRIRTEGYAFFFQHFTELPVVFDDTVMNNGYFT